MFSKELKKAEEAKIQLQQKREAVRNKLASARTKGMLKGIADVSKQQMAAEVSKQQMAAPPEASKTSNNQSAALSTEGAAAHPEAGKTSNNQGAGLSTEEGAASQDLSKQELTASAEGNAPQPRSTPSAQQVEVAQADALALGDLHVKAKSTLELESPTRDVEVIIEALNLDNARYPEPWEEVSEIGATVSPPGVPRPSAMHVVKKRIKSSLALLSPRSTRHYR